MTNTPLRALVGFDGFIDHLSQAVRTRHSAEPTDYDPIASLAELAERLANTSGDSTNLELRPIATHAGGNGPLTSSALAALGVQTTCIAAVSTNDEANDIDPLFQTPSPITYLPVAAPGRTDAIEFTQGKLMLNHPAPLDQVTWQRLKDRVGLDQLRKLIEAADALVTINWTNVPTLPTIWRGLAQEVFPRTHSIPPTIVDISDPARRSDADLTQLLADLRELNNHTPVTLSLNLAEANRFLAITKAAQPITKADPPEHFADRAAALREHTNLTELIIHTSTAAALATHSTALAIPTRQASANNISTGAGDHFTGGYAYALAANLPPQARLQTACETATRYVELGRSATKQELTSQPT